MRSQRKKYEVWFYTKDFDGNTVKIHARDHSLRLRGTEHNKDTPFSFWTFAPTNNQLAHAAGVSGLTWLSHDPRRFYARLPQRLGAGSIEIKEIVRI